MTQRGSFVLITGIGCHASWWLGNILNRPGDGVVFLHEKKWELCGKWKRMLPQEKGEINLDRYQRYWEHIDQLRQRYRIVGDANSWVTATIPAVHSSFGVDRVIYLIRSGISQLYCHWYKPSVHRLGDWWYNQFLYRHWEMLGRPFGKWSKMTKWEKWCFWWWANTELTDWLAERVPNVEIYKTEDITHNAAILSGLVQSFGLNEAYTDNDELAVPLRHGLGTRTPTWEDWIKWKGRSVERGHRQISRIWGTWSKDKRQSFLRICGSRMIELGYEMP